MTAAWLALRAVYQNGWTYAFLLFNLIGPALLGQHTRTSAAWPLLLWAFLVPWARLVYLRTLCGGRPAVSWRETYGLWLVLMALGALIVLAAVPVLGVAAHARLWQARMALRDGVGAVIIATLAMAAGIVVVGTALIFWQGLTLVAYTQAACRTGIGARTAVAQGLRRIRSRPGLLVWTTAQAILWGVAVGAQLLKPTGAVWAQAVWPGVLFTPVVLGMLTQRRQADAASRWQTMESVHA
ncbi:MAG: hypothetical protein M0Z76_04660 [Gammaproteobacteria bacterium]|nr:hypothetical protein [Gammaproteobacteria bacterium]